MTIFGSPFRTVALTSSIDRYEQRCMYNHPNRICLCHMPKRAMHAMLCVIEKKNINKKRKRNHARDSAVTKEPKRVSESTVVLSM